MKQKPSTMGRYIYNLAENKCGYLIENLKADLATNDPLHVHQIRVTTRRLIILLWVYKRKLPARSYNIAKRRLRNSLKMFSDFRDLDNLRDYLNTLKKKKHTRDKSALTYFLRALRANLTVPRRDIAYYSSLGEIQKTVRSVQTMFKRSALHDHRPLNMIPRLASKCLDKQLGVFSRHGKLRYKKKQGEKLHAMRLSAKSLRYTLEIFEGYYKKGFKRQIALLRSFQDTLGRFNDCAVWTNILTGVYKSSRVKETIREEYLHIKERIYQESKKAYSKYKTLFQEHKKQQFRRTLRKVIDYA